jgi:energy-coupling factor transporter transmembrane protein EcfT
MENETILKIILFGLMIFFLGVIPCSMIIYHSDYLEKKKKITFWGVIKILLTVLAFIAFYNVFHPILGTLARHR